MLKHFAKPTTPSAPLQWLRVFFLMAQPPRRWGIASLIFIHSLYERVFG
jgi:hypothetical protein